MWNSEQQARFFQPLQRTVPSGVTTGRPSEPRPDSESKSNVEYRSEYFHTSWTLDPNPAAPGRTLTYGFWIRETTDRILEPRLQGGPREAVWQSLEEGGIRLFRLSPGEPSDLIHGQLHYTTLTREGCPDGYEALSYSWGDATNQRPIIINGVEVNVTENLEMALRYLRSRSRVRTLWIDALCIDQANRAERSDQVQMMLDIFGAANVVFAWLGDATSHTAAGMMLLECLEGRSNNNDTEPPWTSMPPDIVGPGLKDIISREYFRRIWVVQETAIAREVVLVCGSHNMGWTNTIDVVYPFMRAVKAAAISAQWRVTGVDQVDMEPLVQLLQMQLDTGPESAKWKQRRPALDLLDVAYENRHRQASDPRDRLYSLINLVNRSSEVKILPDYSLPVEEVYRQMEAQWRQDTSSIHLDGTSAGVASELPENVISEHRQEKAAPHPTIGLSLEYALLPGATANSMQPIQQSPLADSDLDPISQQQHIILNHVEATLERARHLVTAGNVGRAAALLTQIAQDVTNCAQSLKEADT